MIDAVILTGTVGAGKTTTMHALGAVLTARGVPHALVDMDAVSLLRPAPRTDPFQQELALRNLGDLARNYREAGARVVVVAAVVEHARDLPSYAAALGSHDPMLVRLTVDADAVRARLDARHGDYAAALAWHRDRAPELAAIIGAAGLGGHAIDTTSRTPAEVAELIADRAGW
ncbi:adenylyl-sulfate kinase [Clavibacter michiganensis]|uniref:adenylyl-sulfate kinase n=1 Tax=Clavibacter michiganensis TaxID=28447 RepID=UPI003EBD5C8E